MACRASPWQSAQDLAAAPARSAPSRFAAAHPQQRRVLRVVALQGLHGRRHVGEAGAAVVGGSHAGCAGQCQQHAALHGGAPSRDA